MLKRLFRKNHTPNHIIVVSGLPRSGTSMMMQMLEAGGIEILTDEHRTSDESNPRGYYEFERVKRLADGDHEWLSDARGRAVKVVSALLLALPTSYQYHVIFMQRHVDQVLASQQAMIHAQKPDHPFDYDVARKDTLQHLQSIRQWLANQPHIRTYYVDHQQLIREPMALLKHIEAFLEIKLNKSQMQAVVDPQLYRQRTNEN